MYTVRFTSDVYYDASDHEVAPNLVDETRATPVDVTAGDATGIGTTLALGTTISGDLIVNSSDYTVLNLYDVAGTIVSTKSIQASYLTSYTRNPFTISGVPAGTFLVAAAQYEWDGTSYVHQSDYYIAPDNSYSSDAKVSVTAGQPVTGLNLVVLGTRASVSGQLNTYGFAGNSGAALSDITVYEQLYGEWVKLPWYWNTNPAQANGSTTFNLPLQSATYKFGFEQPFRNPYLGNGPVTPEWWQQKSTLDSADAVTLAEWQVLSGVCGNVHPASVVFTDVPADYQFLTEINWMAAQGITTGYDAGCGAKAYHPWSNVTRDAMAAFLYRYAGSPDYTPPTTSPFIDVSTSNVFYKQIAWLAEQGITTGWTTPAGKEYRPYNPITRDAMAAFLYRFAGNPAFTPPAQSPFVDVATDNTFYREITWLASTGISTGWTTPTGKEYRPYSNITRDAMAAFLYRFHAIP